MSGMDMKVNALRRDSDGRDSGSYNPHAGFNNKRSVLTVLPLTALGFCVPTVVVGIAGGAAFYGLLLWIGASTEFVFESGCKVFTGLIFLFALFDGVPFRLIDRLRNGMEIIEAIIDGWFATDKKAVAWGPWWFYLDTDNTFKRRIDK